MHHSGLQKESFWKKQKVPQNVSISEPGVIRPVTFILPSSAPSLACLFPTVTHALSPFHVPRRLQTADRLPLSPRPHTGHFRPAGISIRPCGDILTEEDGQKPLQTRSVFTRPLSGAVASYQDVKCPLEACMRSVAAAGSGGIEQRSTGDGRSPGRHN